MEMCSHGLHFHKYAEDHVGPYAWQAIQIPSPYICVEAVTRLQLLLLQAAPRNSREVSHPMDHD